MGKGNYHVGQMVKVEFTEYNNSKPVDAYGLIRHLRNKSRIAYIQFLPIHDREDQWCTFDSLIPS